MSDSNQVGQEVDAQPTDGELDDPTPTPTPVRSGPDGSKPLMHACVAGPAKALQTPVAVVLNAAGMEHPETSLPMFKNLTLLQQKIISMISHIPDPMLEQVYHQLVPMVDQHVRQQLMAAMKEHVANQENDSSSSSSQN